MQNLFTRSPLTFPRKLRIILSSLAFLPALAGVSFAQTEAFSVRGSSGESYIYVDSDGKVAIDTSTTLGTLTIKGNDGIIATGTYLSGTALSLGGGTRFMWYPKKAALRAGVADGIEWNDAYIGGYSIAAGKGNTASGDFSTVFGGFCEASGNYSIAVGAGATATETNAMSFGYETQASGYASAAVGVHAAASGYNSAAIGEGVIASGNHSAVMGYEASDNGKAGCFVYGDASTRDTLKATADFQFMAVAEGGFVFYTGYDGHPYDQTQWVGAILGPDQSAWSTISDSTRKENFLAVDGEQILSNIRTFNLRSWNYKGQDPRNSRHYGPMAQEFFNAFGQDEYGTIGNNTTINSADFDGINLIAIQALEKRTAELKEATAEISGLQDEMASLKEEIRNQKQEIGMQNEAIAAMQSQLSELRQVVSVLLKSSPGVGKTVLTSRDGK